jgi:hypothetical protein
MAAGQVKSPAVPSTDSAVPEVRKSKPAKDIESGEEKGSPAESTQICTTDELLTPAVMVPTEAQTKFTASIREDDGGARIGTPTHTRSVAEDGQAAGVAGEAVESNEGLAESEPTGPGLVAGLTGHLDKEAGLQPGPTGLSISIPGANGVSPAEPNRSAQAKHSFAQTQTSDGSMAIIGSRSARSRVAMGESASSLQIPDTVEKLTSEDGSLGEAEEAGESIEPNWDISLELKERKVAVKPKIVEATKDLEAKAIPDPTKESESSPGETRGQEKATKQAPSGQPHEEARLSPATALETIRQDVRDPNGESGASPALQAKKPEEAPKAEPTRGIHQAMETEQTLKGREPRIVSIRIPLVDGDAATRHIDLVFRNRGDALSLRVGVESDSVQQKLTAELPTLLKKLETVDWHLNSPGVTEGVGQTREMLATDSHGRTEFGRSIAENNVPASGQSTSPDEQFNPNQPGNGQSRNQQGQDRRRGGNRINNWRNALAEETTE